MTNTLGAVSATRKLEKPEALSEYGLDSPVLTVRYTASDGKEAEFIVGDTNDAAGGAYLKISVDDAVYLVSSASYQVPSSFIKDRLLPSFS